jgi:predicted metal-binding protein
MTLKIDHRDNSKKLKLLKNTAAKTAVFFSSCHFFISGLGLDNGK